MEVKIGVQNAARELVLDTHSTLEEVEQLVADALTNGGLVKLVDVRGRVTLVPAQHIAYVEAGGGTAGHVGFRS